MRTATMAACGFLAIALAVAPTPAVRDAAAAAAPVPAVTGAPTPDESAGAPAPGTPGSAAAPAVLPEAPKPGTKAPVPPPVPARTGGAAVAPARAVAAEPAPEPRATSLESPPSWGLLLRGGYFGLPDTLANKLFRQHPKVTGSSYGGELRYHGEGGARGIASVGLTVDQCVMQADGLWQQDEFDKPWSASGDITMTAITLTGYWSILPSWWVHPYFGLGVGAAYLKGSYRKDNDLKTAEYWVPAVHIPFGLAIELGDHVQLVAEARVMNGIAAGGAIQVRF